MVVITCNDSALEVDATLTQVAAKSVEVTRFPVEDGSTISDHAIKRPDTYRLDGVISNTPAVAIAGVDPTNATGEEVEAAKFWSDTRAQSARDRIESFVGQACTVDTGSKVFTNMVLEGVEFPRDGATGDAVVFSASFTKVTTAASETAPIPKAVGGTKKKGGKKPTEAASEPVKRKTSAAVGVFDWAKGLFK